MKHDETYYTSRFPEAIDAVARVQRGDAASADAVIQFLEADPYAMGTGYLKENAWKFLKRVELSADEAERLRKVAVHYLQTRRSAEFFAMCKFIPSVSDEKFAAQVRAFTEDPDSWVSRRAALLTAYLESIEEGEALRKRVSAEWYRERKGERAGVKKPGKPRWKSRLLSHTPGE